MYFNYSQIPATISYYPTVNYNSSRSSDSMLRPNSIQPNSTANDRAFGGFLGPFLLGGVTGGLLAPAFYPRPYYYGPTYPPYYYRQF